MHQIVPRGDVGSTNISENGQGAGMVVKAPCGVARWEDKDGPEAVKVTSFHVV